MPFVDVSPNDWFYSYVQYLYCNGVISGYNTNPPCGNGVPCFNPGGNTTRGQVSKIAVLGFGIAINTQGGPHFSDVPRENVFYPYVETLYNAGAISGYQDGTFRPNSYVTRGQLSKITVLAGRAVHPEEWELINPSINTFEDVPVGSTFYQYVETAAAHFVVSGYQCGQSPAGECVPPENKPYFLPSSNATRAQVSKIEFLAVNYRPPDSGSRR